MRSDSVIVRIIIIVVTTILAIGYLTWFAHQSSQEVHALNKIWRQHSQAVSEKQRILHELKTRLGYTGFIHNFKNYVIRRDKHYLHSAKNKLEASLFVLSEYRKLEMTPLESAGIDRLYSVVMSYKQKVLAINHSTAGAMSAEELDRLVRVDDSPALGALEDITAILLREYQVANKETSQLIQTIEFRVVLLMYVGIPFLIIISIFLLFLLYGATRSRSNLNNLIKLLPDGFLLCDNSGNILKTNYRLCELFGYSKYELENMTVEDLMDKEMAGEHVGFRQAFVAKPQMRAMQPSGRDGIDGINGVHKNGNRLPLDIAISSVKFGGELYGLAVIRDKRKELELKKKSETDFLTGVYNRLGINRIMLAEIERANRYDRALSLIVVDIDNFKTINDTHGHLAGDAVIGVVAEAFRKGSRPADIIGRWGGDEFCIICPETTAQEALEFANRMRAAVKSLTAVGPILGERKITLSIGIAELRADSDSSDSLFSRADKAVYLSKEQGKDQANVA